ncbi:hypothetical protein GCM10017687_87830 [Streptomyces echinatus]
MRVDVELAGDAGVARGVRQAKLAVAGGVQDRAVGEDGERHRLADLRLALGEGDLLEVLRRRGGVLAGDGCAGLGGWSAVRVAPASSAPLSRASDLRRRVPRGPVRVVRSFPCTKGLQSGAGCTGRVRTPGCAVIPEP